MDKRQPQLLAEIPTMYKFFRRPQPEQAEGFTKYPYAVALTARANEGEFEPVVRTIGYVAIGRFPDCPDTVVWSALPGTA